MRSNGGEGCRPFESGLAIDGKEEGTRLLVEQGHDGSGIYVRVKTDNSSQTLVTLSGYKAGQAPILLVNATPTWTVEFGEAGCQASGHPVRPPASEPQRLQPQSLRASEPQSLRG